MGHHKKSKEINILLIIIAVFMGFFIGKFVSIDMPLEKSSNEIFDSMKEINNNPNLYVGNYIKIKGEIIRSTDGGYGLKDSDGRYIWISPWAGISDNKCIENGREYITGDIFIAGGIFKQDNRYNNHYYIECTNPLY